MTALTPLADIAVTALDKDGKDTQSMSSRIPKISDMPNPRKEVSRLVRELDLHTFTFAPQATLDDWGDVGITTAAMLPSIPERAMRVTRTFSVTREPALQSASSPNASAIPEGQGANWIELDKRRRSYPVLWDAVSTIWPVPNPDDELLKTILLARLTNTRLNSGGEDIEEVDTEVAQLEIDGEPVKAVKLGPRSDYIGACAAASDDRIAIVLIPSHLARDIDIRLVTST